MAAKRELRAALARLPRPGGAAAQACAAAVVRHLAASPDLASARRVALFAALADEVPTRPIFDLLLRLGRTPLLPRTRRGEALDFAPLARWEDLRRADFGLLEPPSMAPSVIPGPGDLVLTPGLCFDRRGGRLGRGGGYYDRTFPPGSPAPALVALAYACQIVEAVPAGPRDRRVSGVLTEYGMIRTRGR